METKILTKFLWSYSKTHMCQTKWHKTIVANVSVILQLGVKQCLTVYCVGVYYNM